MSGFAKIPIGDEYGVKVEMSQDPFGYRIVVPNDYDVAWPFMSKERNGERLAVEAERPDSKSRAFIVELDKLAEQSAAFSLLDKIRQARTASARKQREIEQIFEYKDLLETTMAFDYGANPQVILSFGIPMDKRSEPPKPGYVAGEVLRTGTYFVVMGDLAGKDNVRYLRAVPTLNLLQGADLADRDDFLSERFPEGSKKFVSFDEKRKASAIRDYVPKTEIKSSKAAENDKRLDKAVASKKNSLSLA